MSSQQHHVSRHGCHRHVSGSQMGLNHQARTLIVEAPKHLQPASVLFENVATIMRQDWEDRRPTTQFYAIPRPGQ